MIFYFVSRYFSRIQSTLYLTILQSLIISCRWNQKGISLMILFWRISELISFKECFFTSDSWEQCLKTQALFWVQNHTPQTLLNLSMKSIRYIRVPVFLSSVISLTPVWNHRWGLVMSVIVTVTVRDLPLSVVYPAMSRLTEMERVGPSSGTYVGLRHVSSRPLDFTRFL